MKEKETKEAIDLAKRELQALDRETTSFAFVLGAACDDDAVITSFILLNNQMTVVQCVLANMFHALEAALAEKGGSL